MKKRILIIDEDTVVCKQIKHNLQNEATDVSYATTADGALQKLQKCSYTLVIMSVDFVDADGIKLLEIIRKVRTIPILVLLSAHSDSGEAALAYDTGADGVLEKHVDMQTLLAHAQALMRRYIELNPGTSRTYTLVFGLDLVIEPQTRKAILHGEPLELTRKEFDMLYYLASNAGIVLTKEQLYDRLWSNEAEFDIEASIRWHIKELRKKLGGSNYIKTVWGVGYSFHPGDERKKR